MSDSVRTHRWQPPGSPIPGIHQARTLEWVAISFSNAWKWKVKVKSLSPVWLSATLWTAAYQAPPSVGYSRQEYWSGLLVPSPILVWMKLNQIKWGLKPGERQRVGFLRDSVSQQPCFLPFLLLFERKYLNTEIGDRLSEHYKGAATKALPFLMIVSVTLSSYVLCVIKEVYLYKPCYWFINCINSFYKWKPFYKDIWMNIIIGIEFLIYFCARILKRVLELSQDITLDFSDILSIRFTCVKNIWLRSKRNSDLAN